MMTGLVFGMLAGVVADLLFLDSMGVGIGVGMCLGMATGVFIKKKRG